MTLTIDDYARAIALVDGLINPPKGGKYYRYAEAVITLEYFDDPDDLQR